MPFPKQEHPGRTKNTERRQASLLFFWHVIKLETKERGCWWCQSLWRPKQHCAAFMSNQKYDSYNSYKNCELTLRTECLFLLMLSTLVKTSRMKVIGLCVYFTLSLLLFELVKPFWHLIHKSHRNKRELNDKPDSGICCAWFSEQDVSHWMFFSALLATYPRNTLIYVA